MKITKTYCLIIGSGAAGLSAGITFLNNFNSSNDTEKCIIVSSPKSNSAVSPWNIMVCAEKEIREKILGSGNGLSDKKVLDTFVKDYHTVIPFMQKLGIKFRKSNIGLVPVLRGAEILQKFMDKFLALGGKNVYSVVTNFLIDNNKEIKGVVINRNGTQEKIVADQVIIASGGLTNLYEYATGYSDASVPNITALALDAGLRVENLEFSMFHPFLIVDKKLPRTLVSGEILQKASYVDENNKEFLSNEIKNALKENKHHSIFPQMTREFYAESLKSKIYIRLGNIDEIYFEDYKKNNEFGWIFYGKKLSDVKKFEIHPAFHYSIGGIKINERAETNKKNIYAAGEVTSGLHGSNRIGGFAIAEGIIFGNISGKLAAERAKTPDIKDFFIIGDSRIDNNLKKEVWENLGPIKHKKKLHELRERITRKKPKSSEEKLVLEMINQSLARKTTGAHFIQ